ncbi:hypothetical protein B0H21DRAFT_223608 [Amylocystis lapponica]|nr:hypothetical protein B0H21DRAFT_223608 [Amylocystis lapponica]
MSCSLCRLPFTPCATATDPHPPPEGTLTAKQYMYFVWAIGIGTLVPGSLTKFEYRGRNMFGNTFMIVPLVLTLQWEAEGGTLLMLHTACCTILRHIFDATDDTKETLVKLSQIEEVLGRPQDGDTAGRINEVNYESVGKDKVDLRQFWIPGHRLRRNRFDWPKFMASGLKWTLNRPDTFPKFHSAVTLERFAALGPWPANGSTQDIITKQPIDILHVLLPYLSNDSFVFLLSTCRLLRHHALTTFQPHARQRVLALGWAVPLDAEHAAAAEAQEQSGSNAPRMAHPIDSPVDGDWLLYLSHVHRTQSMRARRWVWALAKEVRRAYDARLPESQFADSVGADGQPQKSTARLVLERKMDQMYAAHLLFTGKVPKEDVNKMLALAFPSAPRRG